MKRAGARTRTWTVALTDAEWTLAEAVRAQYGGRFGMSRADLVMYWVLRAADHFKDAQPIVAAAIEDLEEERFEDRSSNSIDHGGRRPVANLSLLRHPPSRVDGRGEPIHHAAAIHILGESVVPRPSCQPSKPAPRATFTKSQRKLESENLSPATILWYRERLGKILAFMEAEGAQDTKENGHAGKSAQTLANIGCRSSKPCHSWREPSR